MRILVISRTTMEVKDVSNVTNIAFSSGTYTVTVSGGTTSTYNSSAWYITILW